MLDEDHKQMVEPPSIPRLSAHRFQDRIRNHQRMQRIQRTAFYNRWGEEIGITTATLYITSGHGPHRDSEILRWTRRCKRACVRVDSAPDEQLLNRVSTKPFGLNAEDLCHSAR